MRTTCVLALVLASLPACSDDGAPRPRVRVGNVDGTDATVAAVVEDDVTIYVCGGTSTFVTHTRWFRDGAIDQGGAFSIEGEGGWHVEGTVGDTIVEGSLHDQGGAAFELAASAVSDAGLAGFYTGDHGGCNAGVVVQEEGAQPRAQGVYSCMDGIPARQVIILEPIALTSQGIEVEVTLDSGTERFFVEAF